MERELLNSPTLPPELKEALVAFLAATDKLLTYETGGERWSTKSSYGLFTEPAMLTASQQ